MDSRQTSCCFRSLLDDTDTISIDTAVASSQEFGCLLEMVYTGKLPVGKHNVTRIVTAADSLQMVDIAVGFKDALNCLVSQQQPAVFLAKTTNVSVTQKCHSVTVNRPSSFNMDRSTSDKTEHEDERAEEQQGQEACAEDFAHSGKFQCERQSKNRRL